MESRAQLIDYIQKLSIEEDAKKTVLSFILNHIKTTIDMLDTPLNSYSKLINTVVGSQEAVDWKEVERQASQLCLKLQESLSKDRNKTDDFVLFLNDKLPFKDTAALLGLTQKVIGEETSKMQVELNMLSIPMKLAATHELNKLE
jgi:hypothetical protein